MLAATFVVEVIQELFLALGIALAVANIAAIVISRRRRRAYEESLAAWKQREKKGKRDNRPEEPEHANVSSSVALVFVGLFIALAAFASLTLQWLN